MIKDRLLFSIYHKPDTGNGGGGQSDDLAAKLARHQAAHPSKQTVVRSVGPQEQPESPPINLGGHLFPSFGGRSKSVGSNASHVSEALDNKFDSKE